MNKTAQAGVDCIVAVSYGNREYLIICINLMDLSTGYIAVYCSQSHKSMYMFCYSY